MKIRHKVTLWITGTGTLVGLLFSAFVFIEMKELAFSGYDSQLLDAGNKLIVRLQELKSPLNRGSFKKSLKTDNIGQSPFWIVLTKCDTEIVYRSALDLQFPLPSLKTSGGQALTLPSRSGKPPQTLWVRPFAFDIKGTAYTLCLARSISNTEGEAIDQEIQELALMILYGSAGAILLLLGLNYGVAGRILSPLVHINQLASDIDGGSLNLRLPVGQTKDELDDLSRTLNHMFDRLHHSFKAQKRFVADAAHELKTPITVLRLFLEESIQRTDLPHDYMVRMQSQLLMLRRMSRLVKNLLDLSFLELEQGITRESLDPSKVCQEVLDELADLLQQREIQVTMHQSEALTVAGDREKLTRVMINLLDNAVTYNHDRGNIEIAFFRNRKHVHITIKNTGPGIPEDDLPHVFDQFYRVEKSHSHKHGGTGLGLTIVRQIVTLHGGTIAMESKAGKWCKACMVLPVNAP